jgi:toxin ParE1/3/4
LSEVIWTNAALAQLRAILTYVEQFNPQAAQKLVGELIATGNSLANLPHRGRPVPKTDLRESVTSYPYILRYRISGQEVVILRVRHASRRRTKP